MFGKETVFRAFYIYESIPLRTILELDDGTVISESISICRYLEEIYPNPALFGTTAETQAIIDMWLRRFELDGFLPMLHAVRNHLENFKGRVIREQGRIFLRSHKWSPEG